MSIKDILNDKDKLYKLAKAAFDAVDTDKSGYLERNELEAVMSSVSSEFDFDQPSKEDVDEILKEVDNNGDGNFSFLDSQNFPNP
jgi:Ca2+-binding EF-hand superfamily protein